MSLALETSRLAGAAALTLAYAALCGWAAWRHRRQLAAQASRRAALRAVPAGAPAWLVAYASQTGNAEQLAWQAAQTLHLAGLAVQVSTLNDIPPAQLSATSHLLVIASTYGEGDPPDDAATFAQHMAGKGAGEGTSQPSQSHAPLSHLRYAVLALGDRSYEHFCGFGRQIDQWLRAQQATAMTERVDVDRMDSEAIAAWFEAIAHQAGASDVPEWEAPVFADWQLLERRVLNPGSPGEAVYHLELAPPAGTPLPAWEAGDLAQLMLPTASPSSSPAHGGDDNADASRATPRDYSIASVPEDGRLHLLVRLRRTPEGSMGLMSGWLGTQAQIGQSVPLRLRAHKAFRIAGNAQRPLILIGNGTGIAGLRAHLRHRAAKPGSPPCWLLFGERLPDVDHHYREELDACLSQGVLSHADAVFSRDAQRPQYVQDRLRERGDRVRQWVNERDAAIYVCGSLSGMAAGVDDALRELLGDDRLDALAREGRYRRDVY